MKTITAFLRKVRLWDDDYADVKPLELAVMLLLSPLSLAFFLVAVLVYWPLYGALYYLACAAEWVGRRAGLISEHRI